MSEVQLIFGGSMGNVGKLPFILNQTNYNDKKEKRTKVEWKNYWEQADEGAKHASWFKMPKTVSSPLFPSCSESISIKKMEKVFVAGYIMDMGRSGKTSELLLNQKDILGTLNEE